jgi:quercetin dioxygenase-like cupin family protein
MKTKAAWFAALWLLPLPVVAQAPAVPTMDHEPHHHLALHNDYVKVFNVEVAPGDSIILHSHEQDTIAIAIGDQLVTVGIPGKTIPPSKNADGQVRLQRAGYIHSTQVDGNTPYHTIAVELMKPQTNFHNVCAEILAGQPLNCPPPSGTSSNAAARQTLVESGETIVSLIRVPAHQSTTLIGFPLNGDSVAVIVALDTASITQAPSTEAVQTLQPGDFFWLDDGPWHNRLYQNSGDKEARFIAVVFPHGWKN